MEWGEGSLFCSESCAFGWLTSWVSENTVIYMPKAPPTCLLSAEAWPQSGTPVKTYTKTPASRQTSTPSKRTWYEYHFNVLYVPKLLRPVQTTQNRC